MRSAVDRLKARTAERKAAGLIPDYKAGRPPAATTRAAPAPLARPLPCVELGPKPAGCNCGSGVRTCGLGNGETDGRRGAVRHRDQCQTCADYAPPGD